MEASELRQFKVDELKGRVKQWREELFQAQLKKLSNEMKDNSIFKKLRKDIARGLMVIGEKQREAAEGAPVKAAAPQDKPASKPKAAPKKSAEKKTKGAKS